MKIWLVSFAVSAFVIASSKAVEESCPVHLTLSLTGTTVEDSFLEVTWGPGCTIAPQWIGVFRDDPSTTDLEPEVKFNTENKGVGTFLTNVRVGRVEFPGNWDKRNSSVERTFLPNGKCLKYYVAGFNENKLITLDCLKIQPNWMNSLEDVSKMPLKDLFIPGTYNSGAYFNDQRRSSLLLKYFGFSQNFDVWSQLVFGIRYLDLQIGYDNDNQTKTNETFWVVNENLFVNPLKIILDDIRKFVLTSEEVVIVNIRSLLIGFRDYPERKKELMKFIEEEIGGITLRVSSFKYTAKSYEFSVNDFKKNGKYVLLLAQSAGDDIYAADIPESDLIWRDWSYRQTGFLKLSEVLDYMRPVFSRPAQYYGWIFRAVIFLEPSYDPNKKLLTTRERVNEINSKIGGWLSGPWGYNANVVAVEYFSSTNLVDIAIYANRQKAFAAANKNLLNFEIMY